jgi:hypothetical protein
MDEFILTWIKAFYMEFLDANFLGLEDTERQAYHAARYLQINGPWERFVADEPDWSLQEKTVQFDSAMTFCEKWFWQPSIIAHDSRP